MLGGKMLWWEIVAKYKKHYWWENVVFNIFQLGGKMSGGILSGGILSGGILSGGKMSAGKMS